MLLCGVRGYTNQENSLYNKTNEDTEALKNINQENRTKYINMRQAYCSQSHNQTVIVTITIKNVPEICQI